MLKEDRYKTQLRKAIQEEMKESANKAMSNSSTSITNNTSKIRKTSNTHLHIIEENTEKKAHLPLSQLVKPPPYKDSL